MKKPILENNGLHKKIKSIGNVNRFRIIELTQSRARSITEISRELGLAYSKCADYVRMLEREKLVRKSKDGRQTLVKSAIKLSKIKETLKA